MTSIQERLQLKREPLDKWSIREQLCLASAVARSGDQNWMSVSRALKPFGESNRPADWFHQKNCAAQYGALLGNVETPKRKKRSGVETGVETPAECILKRLLVERKAELKKLLAEEKAEYQKLQEDMKLLQSGKVTEEQLDVWCKEIDAEEYKREQEALARDQWLKQRDLRKQEIERAFRPGKPSFQGVGQKRKISDTPDELVDNESEDNSQLQYQQTTQQKYQQYQQLNQSQQQISSQEMNHQQSLHQEPVQQPVMQAPSQESAKPALSPLLTSLLKSPSQVQNATSVSTSLLHNAITSQNNPKPILQTSNSSPTIASLLNTSAGISVSTGLQQLVSTALGQDVDSLINDDQSQPLDANILDDANIKIDDLASSILDQDGPLPEIKKEEVDDIISEIIENAQDIVDDPDQHLQLDGNGDISINLELEDLEEEIVSPEDSPLEENKNEAKEVMKTPENTIQKVEPVIDPFEFQEDPVLFESPVKPSSMKQENAQYVPLYQQQSPIKAEDGIKRTEDKIELPRKSLDAPETERPEQSSPPKTLPGSVEIVEVVAEEQENEKELNKSQIEDIVHSNKDSEEKVEIKVERRDEESKCLEDIVKNESKTETDLSPEDIKEIKVEENSESSEILSQSQPCSTTNNINLSGSISMSNTNALSSELTEDLYDNINMEVKIDKTGKTKRDYSRPKKKEERNFDMLLAIEKSQIDDVDVSDDMAEPKSENEKVDVKTSVKTENERSNSPWTEEEDKGNKRRYSTPGTPLDSLPNSPASSSAFYDDDRDYKNWKKSVMLVFNRLASNKYASLFLKPINDDQAPGYSSVVYRPMDLQTIKKNIDNGVIRTSLEFKRDVMLMFTNAIMYNKTNDTIYNMALQMQQESMNPIEILLQAQGQVDTPIRRETRTSESSCKRKRVSEEPTKNKKRKEDSIQHKIS